MQLFYSNTINKESEQYTFDKEESRHIVKVLRKVEGDLLYITDGNHFLFVVEISIANDKKCTVNIKDIIEKPIGRNYKIHIVIAATKNIDRIEWFLEKATEIGVDEVSFVLCDRSERKMLKYERLDKIVISAMKQSLKYYKPKINEAISLKEFILKTKEGQLFIAHCEDTNKQSLKGSFEENGNYTILIGPEGDFSPKEIEIAIDNNYKPVSLGDSRLRTETAALVAVHTACFINE